MTRELHVPLLLWVCAGLVIHLLGGSGVVGVTIVEEQRAAERAKIREMVWDVRRGLSVVELDAGGDGGSVEPPPEGPGEDESLIAFTLRLLTAEEEPAQEVEEAVELDPWKAWVASLILRPKEPEPEPEPEKRQLPPPPVAADDAKKAAEAEARRVPEPEVEPPKVEPPKEEASKEKPVVAQILKDKRISIDQVTKDKNQKNDDAQRLAEHANRVDDETQSRIRSQDHKAEEPTPGSNQRGPADQEGNAVESKTGQVVERPGDPSRAPGEASPTNTDHSHEKPPAPPKADALRSGGAGGPPSAKGGAANAAAPSPAIPGLPGGAGPASPEVHEASGGGWTMNPSAPGGHGTSGSASGKPTITRPGTLPFAPSLFGLGMPGTSGGNPNLPWNLFEQAVGDTQLRKEREATGQAIRAQHRGRFDTNKFARFLPDIENYDPAVKLGNQTALNAAQSPFAKYLHDIHNRIHPIFADEFLDSLERLPPGHALKDTTMVAHVEIILTPNDGKVLRRGIVKNSGSTVFDGAALDAVERAGPFGKAPDVIVSKNGFVYLHWEFHRNLVDACSTRNSHPFLVPEGTKAPKANTQRKLKKKGTQKPGDEATQPSGPLVPLRRK